MWPSYHLKILGKVNLSKSQWNWGLNDRTQHQRLPLIAADKKESSRMCNIPIPTAEGNASVALICTESGWAWRSCQNMSRASSHLPEFRKSSCIQTNECNKGQESYINMYPDKLNQYLPGYPLLLSVSRRSHRAVRHARSAYYWGGTQQLQEMCHTYN